MHEIHHRHSIRLKGYDYSQTGYYFVTICTRNRECVFSDVVDGKMKLSRIGQLVQIAWNDLERFHNKVLLTTYALPLTAYSSRLAIFLVPTPLPFQRPSSTFGKEILFVWNSSEE